MILTYFKKHKSELSAKQKLIRYIYLEIKSLQKTILIPTLILLVFGMVMSFSLSYSVSRKLETGDFYFFYKHCFFVVIGICCLVYFATIDFNKLLSISTLGYVLSILLLFSVLFLTSSVKGANRWIDIGLLSLQPSETFKPFFIVMHSVIMQKFWQKNDKNYLFLSLIMFVFAIFLFALEPDYGMIIVYTFIIGVQILFSQIKIYFVLLCGGAFMALLIVLSFTFEHVRFRILTFLGMGEGDNYQLNIAIRAIKEGGIFGKGIGMSNLKNLLPDAHNDFIFAVIGEELGLVGYLFLICCYFSIFISILIFINQQNKYFSQHCFTKSEMVVVEKYYLKRIIALSILAVFFVAFTINSFVSLGLFPTKGMTLPFVSYGGSSILSHCIMMGILLNITRYHCGYFRRITICSKFV